MPKDAFIYEAIRTPRGKGKATGTLNEIKPVHLVETLLTALRQRHDLDTTAIDDLVLGCVSPIDEQGANIARTAILTTPGWDQRVAGFQLNRFCGSGLEAVNLAAMKIASGWEDLVLAGGVESMSRVPMGADGGAWAYDPETNMRSGYLPQGLGADLIATLEDFSREDVDGFALQSQQRAAVAWQNERFRQSVIPVVGRDGETLLERDEHMRPSTTLQDLAKLPAAFEAIGERAMDSVAKLRYPEVDRIRHVHTAGNSSGIVDGAALVLIGSEAAGKAQGLKPRGRIVATAVIGTEPTIMLTGPVPAAEKVLQKAGLDIGDIDVFEVNEAFASVVMRFQKYLGIDSDRINVNGGAIALGHPLGATGAILIGTCLDELERRSGRYGLCTLCVGGGMGIATIIERI